MISITIRMAGLAEFGAAGSAADPIERLESTTVRALGADMLPT